MISNVIIRESCHSKGDAELLWWDEPWVFSSAKTIPELLVEFGIYKTRSDARRAGREGPIKPGFTILRAAKLVPVLCIWNPTKYETEYDKEGRRLLGMGSGPA